MSDPRTIIKLDPAAVVIKASIDKKDAQKLLQELQHFADKLLFYLKLAGVKAKPKDEEDTSGTEPKEEQEEDLALKNEVEEESSPAVENKTNSEQSEGVTIEEPKDMVAPKAEAKEEDPAPKNDDEAGASSAVENKTSSEDSEKEDDNEEECLLVADGVKGQSGSFEASTDSTTSTFSDGKRSTATLPRSSNQDDVGTSPGLFTSSNQAISDEQKEDYEEGSGQVAFVSPSKSTEEEDSLSEGVAARSHLRTASSGTKRSYRQRTMLDFIDLCEGDDEEEDHHEATEGCASSNSNQDDHHGSSRSMVPAFSNSTTRSSLALLAETVVSEASKPLLPKADVIDLCSHGGMGNDATTVANRPTSSSDSTPITETVSSDCVISAKNPPSGMVPDKTKTDEEPISSYVARKRARPDEPDSSSEDEDWSVSSMGDADLEHPQDNARDERDNDVTGPTQKRAHDTNAQEARKRFAAGRNEDMLSMESTTREPRELKCGYKGQLNQSKLLRSVGLNRNSMNSHLSELGLFARFGQQVISKQGDMVSHVTLTRRWNNLPQTKHETLEWWLGEGPGRLSLARPLDPVLFPKQRPIPVFWEASKKLGGGVCYYVGHFRCIRFQRAEGVVFKKKPRQALIEFEFVKFDHDLDKALAKIDPV